MIKKYILFLILFFTITSFIEARILRYKYFAESQRISGSCGKIYSVNTYTLDKNKFSLTLHRFDISANYGATENAEIGLAFNLQDLQDFSKLSNNLTKISPYVKYHIINSVKNYPFDLGIGIYRTSVIIVFEKLLPNLYATSLAVNLNFSLDTQQKFFYTFTVSKYTRWVELIFDSNITNEYYAIGSRYLLTPEIKLDLFFIDLKNITNILFDNFIFGITIKI